MASRDYLSFECVWTQKPGDDTDSFLAAYKRFFETHCGQASVSIERAHQRLPRDSCEDPLWQVNCKLHLYSSLRQNQLETLSIDVARKWCTRGRSGSSLSGHLQWLKPDRQDGFWHSWYAIEKDIRMRSISFGTFAGLNLFAERHTIDSKPRDEGGYAIDCTFKHDERVLQVFLHLRHCVSLEHLYRLTVHYNSIFRVVVYDPVNGPTDVFLHLRTLPLFYKAMPQPVVSSWRPHVLQRQETRDQMDFQRTLEMGCACCSVLESRDVGGCFVVKLGFSDSHEARRTVGRLSRRCQTVQFIFAPVKTCPVGKDAEVLRQQLCSRLMRKLKFPCCYALNALLQRSDDVTMQLMVLTKAELGATVAQLESFASYNEGALEEALFGIGTALENHSIVTFTTALPALFAKLCKSHMPCQVPRGSCLVRRLFVTPSRVFYLPPTIHSENRVLRKFDVDHVLRVSFRDDHFEVLSHTLGVHPQKEQMMDVVVGRFLKHGLKIGDRHFRLLASSASQLRDHGVWLYANDPQGNTVESIRAWMGDFSTMPDVAKKIARMGQCFSTTEESVTVPLYGGTMEEAADIVGGTHPQSRKPYVFSDGIGMISEPLMKKVCAKLDLEQVPSAIQIRYAGYKGMLCTNNALEGDKLVLRKSMNKFACSTSDSLEVIKVSAPSPLFLNRPLITILEQLGVPGRVFLSLQQSMVLQLCDAFESNEAALNVLCTYTNASLPFLKLHLRGMALSREPFTRSLLLAVYKHMIAGLQEKSRIAVPVDKGRNMLGVLDETGTLDYGQVFVQYTAMGVGQSSTCKDGAGDAAVPDTMVLMGTVLVTKCPCLHPGDVRKFVAVDVPALRHIRDCIVFPARGPRPHPNEMAGSDLDGDEYVVIWEESLYFPGNNRPPMTYSDTSLGAPSTGNLNEDIIRFLCNYILNDSVGIMSNAHLAWADQDRLGIFSPVCLSLARKISICLDFAKTGLSESLSKEERPQKYPDFMTKRGIKVNYRSSRVLGELYRLNKTLVGSSSVTYTSGDFDRALFEYPGWRRHEDTADRAKSTYTGLMSQILNQHGIETEAEVIAGTINSVSRYNKSKKDKTSVETLVAKQYRALVATMQDQFLADVDAASRGDTKRTLLEMASAWYMVTCNEIWREENSLGLPWCIPEVLLLLLRERSGSYPLERPLARSLLVKKIDEHCDNCSPQDAAFDLLCKWARNEELLGTGVRREPQVCESFIRRAFQQYVSNEQILSAGGYVSGFLRYLSTVPTVLPVCTGCSSTSQHVHVLTLAALHCYSRMVISRDVCCFGLQCDTDHNGAQEIQESEPIRINTQTGRFLDMVQHRPDTVQELLCRWTGVQQVNIRVNSYRSDKHHYILISAVGRLWQLCCFEELVTQSWLQNAVVRGSLS